MRSVGVAFEELGEPVLREHHRPAERVEVEPEQLCDALARGALLHDGLDDLGLGAVVREPLELVLALSLAPEPALTRQISPSTSKVS